MRHLQVNLQVEGVFVWRDVKHSTLAWRGGVKNTQGQSRDAEVRTFMISLEGGGYKVKDIVIWKESSTWGGVFC